MYRENFLGALFPFNHAPRIFSGGVILNLFGFSIFRYLFFNLRYIARFKSIIREDLQKEFSENGFVKKDALLNQSQVDSILDFYRINSGKIVKHSDEYHELVISNTKGLVCDSNTYNEVLELLKKETDIFEIASKTTGLIKEGLVSPYISIIQFNSFVESGSQKDGVNTPHIDVFYPSTKFFIYLNEVNINNGAFTYLKGSNRFSVFNCFSYYLICLKYYFFLSKKNIPVDAYKINRNHNKKHDWIVLGGNAGDSVIFNVQGIHKRGEFDKSIYRERKVLLVDFRQSEGLFKSLLLNV